MSHTCSRCYTDIDGRPTEVYGICYHKRCAPATRVFRVPITVDVEVTVLRTDDLMMESFAAQAFVDSFVSQLKELAENAADPIRVKRVTNATMEEER